MRGRKKLLSLAMVSALMPGKSIEVLWVDISSIGKDVINQAYTYYTKFYFLIQL